MVGRKAGSKMDSTVTPSPGFSEWLYETGNALAITTSEVGKLLLIGAPERDRLSVVERTFYACRGIVADGKSLYVTGADRITRFEQTMTPGGGFCDNDVVYAPRITWHTGNVFAHDIGLRGDGSVVFANTMFSCLCIVGEAEPFTPIWQPSFIVGLLPQDRCHLNGLAMEDGIARYVTVAAQTNTRKGWGAHRHLSGLLIDVQTGEIVSNGLSMPHSPRTNGGVVYLCNAGTGEVGLVNGGRFIPMAQCYGFTRGLAFLAYSMLVGVSLARSPQHFSGLPLEAIMRGSSAACRLLVLDGLGRTEHSLEFSGDIREIYDIACIEDARNPSMVILQ